jgi:Calcineurin-like phosphoesterase
MIEAVMRQEGADHPAAPGLFEVHPPGVEGAGDFTFLVIGDPGEGDESQHSLRDRYLELGHRPDVAFLVISSDVIYPDSAMKDYEPNFYLPFKGFRQPIYGLPGNHDWFNALNAFNANFLLPRDARAAMRARVETDHGLTSTTDARIDELIAEAARLRREFGVRTGEQPAPFFEFKTDRFALIVVDTGVLRTIDPLQQAWLESALERDRGRFTMMILGHPLYAGGHDQGAADPAFGKIHELLRRHEVPVVMAGDTHDFEYYREDYPSPGGSRVMHHFVNGGGGAYLSIGTALD